MKRIFAVMIAVMAGMWTVNAWAMPGDSIPSQDTKNSKSQDKSSASDGKAFSFQMNIEASGMYGKAECRYFGNYPINGATNQLESKTTDWGGPAIDMTIGVRYRNWLFVGGGAGVHGMFAATKLTAADDLGNTSREKMLGMKWYVPIYADVRFLLSTPIQVNPFLETAIGGYVGLRQNSIIRGYQSGVDVHASEALRSGYYMRIGAGVEIMKVILGIGYELTAVKKEETQNILYAKIGVKIGGKGK